MEPKIEPRIYAASRASIPERPAMWNSLRAEGLNIVSSWIDEAEPGATADLGELWERIYHEIKSADQLILYVERGDFPLKGALIEVGMALGLGKPVVVVSPLEFCAPSYRPIGSWIKHPAVRIVKDIQEALEHAPSSPATPTPRMSAAEFYRRVWIKENGSDPRGDWPIHMAEAYAIYRLKVAAADLQRKDAALRLILTQVDRSRRMKEICEEALAHSAYITTTLAPCGVQDHADKAQVVGGRIGLSPELTPPAAATLSPCCANPNMVVKGLCDLDPDSDYLHTKEEYSGACSNWRPTHNVCLNCGKEEKI